MANTLNAIVPEAPVGQSQAHHVVLATRQLCKRYGERMAVDHLDLQVRQGEIFGFLGPNGAGKTTTIRMVLGLITPTSGTVEIFGREVTSHRAEVLPRVGALIEAPALYHYMSGRDNLRAVALVLGGVPETRIDAVLETVGLQNRQRDRVKTYSLGMKQRLGVAMALLQNPDVLVLDEPANGLDPAGIVEMRDLMRQLSAAGKTIFISSHVLSEVRQICTRVGIMNLGKLITESTVDELVSSQGDFAVRLEPGQAQAAVALLQQQPWAQSARFDLETGTVVTPAPGGRGRDLNLFLVQNNLAPESLAPQTVDLEQVFLQLTGNGERGIQ
jgi:ABC-2 type transport system ATP-binding protein